ncbi:MAG: hypothetical protein IKZ52_06780 [Bacteroidales bacterium]|nr:hypothetical protein [Bacteroidales bacterium]
MTRGTLEVPRDMSRGMVQHHRKKKYGRRRLGRANYQSPSAAAHFIIALQTRTIPNDARIVRNPQPNQHHTPTIPPPLAAEPQTLTPYFCRRRNLQHEPCL